MTARRVLVTRPEPGCSRTAGRVAALGFEPVKLPVAEAESDPLPLKRALGAEWSALAVTSANAVRTIESVPEAVAAWRDLPVFAVGAKSAACARRVGFARVEEGGGTGRGLAGSIVAAAETGNPALGTARPLLYCAGKTRSDAFERALQLAAVPFSVAECYAMRPLAYPATILAGLVARPFEAALFYSHETAVSFFRLMAEAGLMDRFHACRIICLSDKVAAALPATLQDAGVTAGRPSEEAVLEILAAMRN